MTPTLQDFMDVMTEAFSPETEVKANTFFRELEEWSSMQALIVIAAVDEHFEITLPEKEFRKAQSFDDLYNLTVSLKSNV